MENKLWSQNTKFFVIVNYFDYDVSWANNLKMPHVIYTKNNPTNEPFNAVNKAKSETNILKFIYEFYDDLPQNIITVHQYNIRPWQHRGDMVDILNDPSFEQKYNQSKVQGFMNLNHYILGDVDIQIPKMKKSGWWESTMEPYFGNIYDYGNWTRGKIGCAQYVVSRDRILSLPRDFYTNMYDWLVNNSLSYPISYDKNSLSRKHTPIDGDIKSDYYTSRYMEWSWELIFTARNPEDSKQITHNGHSISASYGALKYHIDVSHIIPQFINQDYIIIDKCVKFNDVFSDPLYGQIKTLTLIVDNKYIYIDENRQSDVKIAVQS